MWVQSLGWEDPQRREWQPTPVFLPGESHGQRSLAGYSPGDCKESDPTERLSPHILAMFQVHTCICTHILFLKLFSIMGYYKILFSDLYITPLLLVAYPYFFFKQKPIILFILSQTSGIKIQNILNIKLKRVTKILGYLTASLI